MTVEVAILAGGKSRRMGRRKSALKLGSSSMLKRVYKIGATIGNVKVVTRDFPRNSGPLTGIITALRQTDATGVLFLSCDMPFVSQQTLQRFLSKKGPSASFIRLDGKVGFPFYIPRSKLPIVEAQFARGELSLQKLATALRAKSISPTSAQLSDFLNVNTPADFEEAQRRVAAEECIIAIDKMVIRRGKVTILDKLSWQVKPGEHWAILGANGSGKTSLLSALTGYFTPSAGHISVLGHTYGESDWRELRKKVGLVSSSVRQLMAEPEPALYTVASGKDAVIDYWGKPDRTACARAMSILKQVECEYLADRPWAVLSQGERQRVLIGRALMGQPALLILDEPCAGLDPAARERFLQFIERLGRDAGAPSITLVTHHVEEIVGPFKHVLLLKDGRVLARGSRKAMLTNALLSQTFSAPVKLYQRKRRFFLEVAPSPSKIA